MSRSTIELWRNVSDAAQHGTREDFRRALEIALPTGETLSMNSDIPAVLLDNGMFKYITGRTWTGSIWEPVWDMADWHKDVIDDVKAGVSVNDRATVTFTIEAHGRQFEVTTTLTKDAISSSYKEIKE